MAVALVCRQQESVDGFSETLRTFFARDKDRGSELVCYGDPRRKGKYERSEPDRNSRRPHIRALRNLSEFSTTEIDDALIAKAANIGLIRMPKKGKRMPAATGTPEAL